MPRSKPRNKQRFKAKKKNPAKAKANTALVEAKGKRKPDPDGYYFWLIGKGYDAGVAMRMVSAKFDPKTTTEKPLDWAWKDK